MAKVLTTASTVLCGTAVPFDDITRDLLGSLLEGITPAELDELFDDWPIGSGLHGGRVNISTNLTAMQNKLKVNGNAVLLGGDIHLKIIPRESCQTPGPSSYTSPCSEVTTVSRGQATKLKVNGRGVMLEGLQGNTDGIPRGTLDANANQTKLEAI